MTKHKKEQPTEASVNVVWQGLRSWLPMGLSLAAVIFSGLQWIDTRQQRSLSTRPLVDFLMENDPDDASWTGLAIKNNGPGKTFLIVRAITLRALKAPGSRHLIARFRQNAVWTSIAGDSNATLFFVARKCFDGLTFQSHRQEGYFELPNGSTIVSTIRSA
jgi:hypothetical protein